MEKSISTIATHALKRRYCAVIVATLVLTLTASAAAPGSQAPNSTGTDSIGKTHSLPDYRGHYVVLEWSSEGCPYDQKHYATGSMEKLQKKWTGKGVIWLSIISSAPGMEGYVSPSEENSYLRRMHASPTAALLDPSGTIGRLYGAKTTPHMFVIDPSGKLIYAGAIDDRPSYDVADLAAAKNYVDTALTEATSGQPVHTASTRPYGCSVKYAY
jgi:peroxiredoxin